MHRLEAGGWQTLGGYVPLAHRLLALQKIQDQTRTRVESCEAWFPGQVLLLSRLFQPLWQCVAILVQGCCIAFCWWSWNNFQVYWSFGQSLLRSGYSSFALFPWRNACFFFLPNLIMWFHSGNNPFVGYYKYLLPVCDFPFLSPNGAILMQTPSSLSFHLAIEKLLIYL